MSSRKADSAPVLNRAMLEGDLRSRVFRCEAGDDEGLSGPEKVGLEVELIPRKAPDGGFLPLGAASGFDERDGTTTLDLVRRVGHERGWMPSVDPGDSPTFLVPGGGKISFEPGGQIEYSSPALHSVDSVLVNVESVVAALVEEAEASGIVLVTRGIDPLLGAESVRIQLGSARYARLAAHFSDPGGAGRRMMLQTAALHVCLDFGGDTKNRWRAANALVPYLIATFANSVGYAGAKTAFRSYRSQQWRSLDPARTGVFSGADPVGEYLSFALNAGAILMGPEGRPARPFAEWLAEAGQEDWRFHLSTLFPEVRPRGYMEIRAIDALPPRWYAAPLVFATALLYDREALHTVLELLEPADRGALVSAGREGVLDPERGRMCVTLFDLALDAARRLGEDVIGERSLETARAYLRRYTSRGEDPAGDEACAFAGDASRVSESQRNTGSTSTAPSSST